MSGNKDEVIDAREVIVNIIENYKRLEESVVDQLGLSNKCHALSTGTSRENIWLQLFERMIPKKFVIENSVFIIDSNLQKSREVDLAIIDNTYTPYIFQYGKLKFVPIEAVAAVVECKSSYINDASLDKWCNSIEMLRTSRESIVRMATGTVIGGNAYGVKGDKPSTLSTQTSTRPIRIFCGYKSEIKSCNKETMKKFFDFILTAKEENGEKRIDVEVRDFKNLKEWYEVLDHYEYPYRENIIENKKLEEYSLESLEVMAGSEKISLMTLNLQLNQLLMLINNPISFPHLSYANMFNKVLREQNK